MNRAELGTPWYSGSGLGQQVQAQGHRNHHGLMAKVVAMALAMESLCHVHVHCHVFLAMARAMARRDLYKSLCVIHVCL